MNDLTDFNESKEIFENTPDEFFNIRGCNRTYSIDNDSYQNDIDIKDLNPLNFIIRANIYNKRSANSIYLYLKNVFYFEDSLEETGLLEFDFNQESYLSLSFNFDMGYSIKVTNKLTINELTNITMFDNFYKSDYLGKTHLEIFGEFNFEKMIPSKYQFRKITPDEI